MNQPFTISKEGLVWDETTRRITRVWPGSPAEKAGIERFEFVVIDAKADCYVVQKKANQNNRTRNGKLTQHDE